MALAHLSRFDEARQALETGRRKAPFDKRFSLELAGIAFKLGDSKASKRQLRRALKIDPQDAYGDDFLATLYLLEGNLEASLKYWNRIGKPRIEDVHIVPPPRMDPVLLDRILAFSPAASLMLRDLASSRERLEFTDVFPAHRFELAPRLDGNFDLLLHVLERDGWGGSITERLLSVFKEIPYQTVHFDLFNIRGLAANFESFYRWDAQKRRLFASYSSPLRGDPRWRFKLWLDGRNENWSVPHTISPILFNLQKLKLGAGLASVISDRWEWDTGVSLSERRFIQPLAVDSVPSGLFANGPVLEYQAGLRRIFDLPEKRLRAQSTVTLQLDRTLSGQANHYMKAGWGLNWSWLPQARGDDYRFSGRLRVGRIFGQPSLDELYCLGTERDNDLYMRGHSGTIGGMKGAGPLGEGFVLLNNEMDKIVHRGAFWSISLGPFLDSGRAFKSPGNPGSTQWLWDAGVQSKFTILRGLTFGLSYGWDLRSGRGVFYSSAF